MMTGLHMNRKDASAIKEGLTELLAELVRHVRTETRAELAALEHRLLGEIEKRKGFEYAGTYQPGQSYSRDQGCTYQGSLWIAVRDFPSVPGRENSGWRLAVKRGRDARDR
jgi:hypothetical protein